VEGDVRGVQIEIDVIRSYVASALNGVRDGEPSISLTDINDTGVKTVSTVSGPHRRATYLARRLLRVTAFRVEGERAFQIICLCSSEEDGADTKEDGGELHGCVAEKKRLREQGEEMWE
jgi:hypothetical protein